MLGETRNQQARLHGISKDTTTLSPNQQADLKKQTTDLEQLMHGIIKLMVAKVFNLRTAVDKMAEVESVILSGQDADDKLKECMEQSTMIDKTIRQLGPLDQEKSLDLELLKFLVRVLTVFK